MVDLKPCPWCKKRDKLSVSLHQALAKKTRYGAYDSAVYCRRCGAYGPKVRSETLTARLDVRNEQPGIPFKEAMQKEAVIAWNAMDGGGNDATD